MTACCSTVEQSEIGTNMSAVWLHELHWM